MLRVDLTELGQKMADLKLKIIGQGRRGEKCLFKLKRGLAGGRVDRGEDMRIAGKVGVDRAGQGKLGLTQGEAALFRIVASSLYCRNRGVSLAGATGVEHHVSRNVNQAQLRISAQRL